MDSRPFAAVGILVGTFLGCATRDPGIILPEIGDPCTPEMVGGVACGSMQFPFRGRVVFEGSDRPEELAKALEVLSGFYKDGEWIGQLILVDATILDSGEFSFDAGASYSTRHVCRDGEWQAVGEVLDAHYLFRAPGCHDTVVIARQDGNEQVVTISCSL